MTISWIGFRATRVPRLPESTPQTATRVARSIQELLLKQHAMWASLRVAMRSPNEVVELRLSSAADTRAISISIRVASLDLEGISPMHLARQFLPSEYGWEPEQAEPAMEGCWYVARVIRRIVPVSLPSYSGLLQGPSITRTHRFISPFVPVKEQLESPVNLFLPSIAALGAEQPERLHLLTEMQRCAPAVVSITMHLPDPTELERAQFLSRCLGVMAQSIISTPLVASDYQEGVRTTFDRLLLPPSDIYSLRMRVASPDPTGALAIASALAFSIGSVQAFEVLPPSKPLRDASRLVERQTELKAVKRSLAAVGFATAQDYKLEGWGIEEALPNFIDIASTHFTPAEALRILRLPFSHEDGLPGVLTEPIIPFRTASAGYFPVVGTDVLTFVESHVRLGIMQDGSVGGSSLSEAARWHALPRTELCKHALVSGSTGSGKTVATTFLVREMDRLHIPMLIVEPVKTEYFGALSTTLSSKVQRFNFEPLRGGDGRRGRDYFVFDPMLLSRGTTVARHVNFLKACFQAAFPMEEVLALLLENGLLRYYTGKQDDGCCGINLLSSGDPRCPGGNHFVKNFKYGRKVERAYLYPSSISFIDYFLEVFIPKEFERQAPRSTSNIGADFQEAFRRRFDNLLLGPLGISFEAVSQFAIDAHQQGKRILLDPIPNLLHGHAVLELDALTDNEQKALVMAFVLALMFEKRQAEHAAFPVEEVVHPLHCMIVEEAHRLLSREGGGGRGEKSVGVSAGEKARGLFVEMLAEIRALGQAIVLVEQIPSKLVSEALKNTNLKVVLRQTSSDDRDYLGDALSLTDEQKRYLGILKPGEAVVFDAAANRPMLVRFPAPLDQTDHFRG